VDIYGGKELFGYELTFLPNSILSSVNLNAHGFSFPMKIMKLKKYMESTWKDACLYFTKGNFYGG
jgi:hypothetical protein